MENELNNVTGAPESQTKDAGLQWFVDAVNFAEKMRLSITAAATDDNSVKGDFVIDDCGDFTARINSIGLVVECDLPGDENNNPDFTNFITNLQAFYVKECAHLIKTFYSLSLDGGKMVIKGEADTLTTFAKYCSLKLVAKDASSEQAG